MNAPNHVEADTANNDKGTSTNAISVPTTANSTSTAAVAAHPPKPWKLRQTCDLCSEAKVKCDKGNPRCGRCDRLSYECVYSPARRIGRPRPRSPGAHDRGRPTRDDDTTISVATNHGITTTTNNDQEQTVKEHAAPARTARPADLSLNSLARPFTDWVNEPLPECLSDDADPWSAPPGTSAGPNRANTAMLSIDTRDDLLGGHDQPASNVQDTQHAPYEYDCATVAVATLRRLAAAGLDGRVASQPTAAMEVLADQIPQACREAARILVCPCSAEVDMALLTAALAAAILEVADAALRTLQPAGNAPDDGPRTVLALGILPKISQVVNLFTHRYSVTQVSRPPEAVFLLAASLRTTLKAMAEDTTNRFLDSGAAVSRGKVAT